ncbi:plastocyanin/azurin family copper-binding protein [Halorussus gelatinilyticus]|uniref:Plastocyanin/azurin family copper-binding protein n=1 Tax=Halorussus gelatinilyticus TaxID=2937524 RepID=A0A8U0IDU9_9EURY|nr:plastocyanin/azurin family copper-binding protein [Halorussus gelatinilyticus]UPV98895.1 plastocyanin/azurin family copper-binding protein [Halorussus gelatinilyticus]
MTDSTRRRFLRRATTAAATASLAGLAGCTGALSERSEQTPTIDYTLPEATASAEVRMGPDASNRFDPAIVRVETGGTVTWTNVSRNHSATAYAPANDYSCRIPEGAESWDTGVFVENGKSSSHTFETPGVYDYYCTPHEPLGMVGTVVVGDPDPADQPGLQPPDDGRSDRAASKLEALNHRVRSGLKD